MLALTVLVYWPGLSGPLLLDDRGTFMPLLNAPPAQLFSRSTLAGDAGPLGRPLAMATFALNVHFTGDDFGAWKLVNLGLHVACGISLFLFLCALLKLGGMPRDRTVGLSIAVTAIWLLHPLQVSTVLYTVQRMALLSSLFVFLGAGAWCWGRLTYPQQQRFGLALMALGFVGGTGLATAAKETGLLLPYLVVAMELTVARRAPGPAWLGKFLAVLALAPMIALSIYLGMDFQKHFLNAYYLRDFSPLERLLTQVNVVVDYLRWIVLPRISDYGFFHDDVEIVRHATGGAFVGRVLVLAGLMSLSVLLRCRQPLVAFGLAWFFIGHALESTIFGLELVFEHRNYLPSIGIILALAAGIASRLGSRPVQVAVVALTLMLALLSVERARLWGDAESLHKHFLRLHPDSVRASVSLVEWYVGKGAYAQALELLGSNDRPDYALARIRIACLEGRPIKPKDLSQLTGLESARRLSYYQLDSLSALTQESLGKRCSELMRPLTASLETLKYTPMGGTKRYRLFIDLARLYRRQGDAFRAMKRIEKAADFRPADPFVHYLIAEFALDEGAVERARQAQNDARVRGGEDAYPAVDRSLAQALEQHQ